MLTKATAQTSYCSIAIHLKEGTHYPYKPVALVNASNNPISPRNLISLFNTAIVCDRYGISDRPAAAVATAILQDVGLINEADTSLVIDRHR